MDWWGATKRVGKRIGGAFKRKSGEIARETIVVAAAATGAAVCAPIALSIPCAAGAALATDTLVGDRIERTTRRAVDKTGAAADDFVGYLRGGESAPRPPGMATTVSGTAAPTRVTGEVDEVEDGASVFFAIGGGTIAAAAVILLVLKKTGKI